MPEWPCTICREPLTQADSSACPCGHVYHYQCLERWLQRSNSCPTCRQRTTTTFRLYFSNQHDFPSSGAQNGNDLNLMTEQLSKEKALALEKDNEIKTLKESLREYCKRNETLKREFDKKAKTVDSLKEQLSKEKALALEKDNEIKSLEEYHEENEKRQRKVLSILTENLKRVKLLTIKPERKNQLEKQLELMRVNLSHLESENKKFQEAKDKAQNEKAQIEKNYNSLRQQLISKDVECQNLRKKLETQDDQLNEIEEEKKHLKKKLDKIKKSFDTKSPRSTRINRLFQESPAPIKLDENISFSSHTESNKEESERKESEMNKIGRKVLKPKNA